ncbi:MAG: FAD-dependent oxidoreductase [Oscillospiraceae bacterium]|nr:FAD-dependent oxidoreductase [Oscillospiraceae bacterium]
MKLFINSKEVAFKSGETVLQIARNNGVDIPSLCHYDAVKTYGSCGICMVECITDNKSARLIRACSTVATDGMVINTENERITANRRLVLDLLLSDHSGDCKPPCALACPAETDCQGYVKLIADGSYSEAKKLITEKIPFPASIGRVCPRPCEDACRRGLVEEPVAIAQLKQFIGDNVKESDLNKACKPCAPSPKQLTGKTVAVIGGGPGGLSAAFYLRLKGHSVTIFEAMPKMGGMLQYGIPEYRLPKSILQKEIDVVSEIGVEFRNNEKIRLDDVKDKYDAIIVALGAWKNTDMRCAGEELSGVIGGIDFLREPPDISGKLVAVVGGGNTAMDVCRTAIRLGAKSVYCIYRRTRDEMPAQACEITEAEEEGVVFKFLTNPIEIKGENNTVNSVLLQVMELGEADASGRRAPVPIEGRTELLKTDIVISAIGQKPNLKGFDALEKTNRGTIIADPDTFLTNVDRVFAIGDATNKGADIAVSAIGEAGRCAKAADGFLRGEDINATPAYLVKDKKNAEDFAAYEKQPRVKIKHRSPQERAKDWGEIYTIFDEESARKEANRCLECGCSAYRDNDCGLIEYANRYSVQPDKYAGEVNRVSIPRDDHPDIIRNPEKCILCGLCVRVCDEVEGVTALGFAGRGFDTIVKPALDKRLKDTTCNSCGRCEEICPTGALTQKYNSKI